ncbi:transposase [Streptomyces sp. NPDC017179]|uniref:transposase n=1 Tax=Streptomyces sp. NPDC017179 TaxID=3364979 RepID=UPI0037923117
MPLQISDEEWETADAVLPESRQNWTPKREVFEAILWKLRTAARWSEVQVSGNSWSAVRRRAEAWRGSGAWQAAMEALKGSGGVPVPPSMVLPPMEVTGSIDPKFAALELETCEGDGDCCNQNHTNAQSSPRWSSSGSSSRSCSWCCSLTCSAAPCRSRARPIPASTRTS